MSSSDDYSSLKKEIQETMKTYTELLETISEKESNEINQTLWKIRADLETIVIEFKYSNWCSEFVRFFSRIHI